MRILGINAFHGDSSAALVVDGQLVAAAEEERFRRIKHWAGFPTESIAWCLSFAGLQMNEIDHVAISSDPSANWAKKLGYTLKKPAALKLAASRLLRKQKSDSIPSQLPGFQGQIHRVEHHDAHLAHGFLTSPFEEAAILSVDGMGDFVSTVAAIGRGTEIERLAVTHYPNSLGFLYNALTIYLGFPNYGDEYKVMGLAPYGEPEFAEEIRKLAWADNLQVKLAGKFFSDPQTSWDGGAPSVEPFHTKALEELLGPARDPADEAGRREENIAASLQLVTEEILIELANNLGKRADCPNLVLVGGCAMNSVAAGKLVGATSFENCFVPGGAADNGTAIGAAFHVWNRELANPRSFEMTHAFWGPDADQCDEGEKLDDDELATQVVDLILNGGVVGWFQGRAEFGARALGNRSLLADPRREDMRDLINTKIKYRERFRPFAPSVLEEHVADWFEDPQPSPFMDKVLSIRAEKREKIPAVTHVDGSGRLQTVSSETNPRYWRLIDRFRERTGVPMLLNTSLNENEPIVNTAEEALACFRRTQMDAIIIGNRLVTR